MPHQPPQGHLYSRLYIERGAPMPDSARFRVRLGQYFYDKLALAFGFENAIRSAIPLELGVQIEHSVMYFFKVATIHDVLGAITLFDRQLQLRQDWRQQTAWRVFVQQALQDENLAYRLDEDGGVHPLVDVEFGRNVTATIRGLDGPRHAAARAAFERAQANFEQTPPDMKGALRDIFEAAETLTKLISRSGKTLDAAFVRAELQPRVQRLYAADAVAQQSGARICSSFKAWVDAVHPYRHGQHAVEPVEPPTDLAIVVVSQGASFLRWLVDLDGQIDGAGG